MRFSILLRSSLLWGQLVKAIRAVAPRPPAGWRVHLHFRGWFSVRVLGAEVQLFNANTVLETALFWSTDADVETSLICFSALSGIATHILDIGANTGIFAVLASSFNRKARVFALEPSYGNFAVLRANVKRNGLPVSCLYAAATNDNKLVTLWDFDSEISYTASLEEDFRKDQGVTPVQVVGIKVSDLVRDLQATDVLLSKIDVESHEAEVVRGMLDVLKNETCQAIFVIEIIREKVSQEVERLLPPDRFAYFRVRDESRTILESKHLSVFDGLNYLVVSRNMLGRVLRELSAVAIVVGIAERDEVRKVEAVLNA